MPFDVEKDTMKMGENAWNKTLAEKHELHPIIEWHEKSICLLTPLHLNVNFVKMDFIMTFRQKYEETEVIVAVGYVLTAKNAFHAQMDDYITLRIRNALLHEMELLVLKMIWYFEDLQHITLTQTA
jgi:hypothetical protein